MAGSTIKRVQQADIERSGTAIIIPDGMSLEAARDHIDRRMAYENETTAFIETVECFPWDGAVALNRVLMRRYGWAQAEPTPGFFGKEPPKMIGVDVGPNTTMQVPWGRFTLPNIKGWIQTGSAQRDGRIIFQINAEVLRKHEHEVKMIADEVRDEVRLRSIYRGKSIKMKFSDDNGERLPLVWPKFLDVSQISAGDLLYSDQVNSAIQTNLITPLEHYEELRDYGIPFKRGVLLAGVLGTGKTLAAFYAANRANAKGITFVYVEKAADFSQAVTFARQYLPAVVFCEDIDRVTAGDRDAHMDMILNTIDGIDSKTGDLMVVLTTNDVDAINKTMLRPGRLDGVVFVTPPDAKTVIKLIKLYGRGLLDPTSDLTEVANLLAGEIPAVVREVVEHAKLAALRLRSLNGGSLVINAEALMDSAHTKKDHMALLNRADTPTPTEMQMFGTAMGREVAGGITSLVHMLAQGHSGVVYDNETNEGSPIRSISSSALPALAAERDAPNHNN